MTQKPKIVVIGGGTGTYTVLLGLKKFTSHLTAIVTMADSGGSAGRLRDEFGILPPGDVRRALLALSDAPLKLRQLFEYRFDKGSSLNGHSFGNLFLTALTDITGNEEKAIKEAGKILNIQGKVVPISLEDYHLCARLEDGSIIKGESNIDIRRVRPDLKILDIFLDNPAKINPKALRAILAADLVVIGPGDLYTSLLVNFLVKGVAEAIQQTKAKVVFILNIMNKHGETDGFKASNYLQELFQYAKSRGIIDYLIINKSQFPKDLLEKYQEEKAFPVEVDLLKVKKMVPKVIRADLTLQETLLRHDPEKLARAIISLLN